MQPFYHIVDQDEWQAAQVAGSYHPASVDDEGFIHCSYAHQLLMPANAFYQGQPNLVLLRIDPARITAPIREDVVEVSHGGVLFNEGFPHIYGALNPDAVVAVIDFPPGPDGRFTLPPEVEAFDDPPMHESGAQHMTARNVILPIQVGQLNEAVRIFIAQAVPAIRQQPGLQHIGLLTNAEANLLIIQTLWESAEQEQATERSGFVKAQIAKVAELMAGPPRIEHYTLAHFE
jgi:uncharacterized protein (DUF952 family)/quinol monooxygenase YgiN